MGTQQKSLNQLRNEIHEWAREKGFWQDYDRLIALEQDGFIPFIYATKLCLIHSEISEAWEAFQSEDTGVFKEELADIAIRAFDLAGALNIDIESALFLSNDLTHPYVGDNSHYSETHHNLLQLHKQCSDCLEAWRASPNGVDVTIHFTIPFIIELTERIFGDLNYSHPNWYQSITAKMDKNHKRPFRHGKAF